MRGGGGGGAWGRGGAGELLIFFFKFNSVAVGIGCLCQQKVGCAYWSDFGRIWSDLVKFGPTKSDQNLTKSDQI